MTQSKKLLELMEENPDLPVVPIILGFSDDYFDGCVGNIYDPKVCDVCYMSPQIYTRNDMNELAHRIKRVGVGGSILDACDIFDIDAKLLHEKAGIKSQDLHEKAGIDDKIWYDMIDLLNWQKVIIFTVYPRIGAIK